MAAFDRQTVALLEREREVEIVPTLPDGSRLSVTIWVVVDDGDAFIRSWRGAGARWYRAAIERPDDVELVAAGRRVPVRVVPTADPDSVARCSAGYEAKYAGHPSTPRMVRDEVLDTTLRVEPR